MKADYFYDIKSPNQAYWLGFLSADGYVSDEYVSVTLAVRDAPHLEMLRKDLEYSGEVKYYVSRGHKTARLALGCRRMCRDLQDLGLYRDKSYSLVPWQGMPSLMSHYWRGVVDGDGSISQSNKTGQWTVYLCGTKAICEGFKSHVASLVQTKVSVRRGKGNGFEVKFCGVTAPRAIAGDLYEDANRALERKKARASILLTLELQRMHAGVLGVSGEHFGRTVG